MTRISIAATASLLLFGTGTARAELTVDYSTEILNPAQNVIDLAVDAEGNVWVVGNVVFAPAFSPTPNALEDTWQGPIDVFVAKLDGEGGLVYGTYIPTASGSADQAGGVAVDGEGNVYVTGDTVGGLTMTTPDAFQQIPPGNTDTFLVKLDPQGGLLYATHIGGNGKDSAALANDDPTGGVTVDREGNVFVVGSTTSTDFPVLAAVQEQRAGGNNDAFVMKFDADFNLQWSTYYGNDFDYAKRATADREGNLYVLGWADEGFPTTPGAFQEAGNSFRQYFVAKFTPGGQVAYATYFNGVEERTAFTGDIGVGSSGQVVIGGYVFDGDIVTTPGAFQFARPSPTQSDAFLAKLNTSGTDLVFSSYLGGSQGDATAGAVGIGADGAGFISGVTNSGDFPVTEDIDPLGSSFLAKVTPDGNAIVYATRLNIDRVRSLEVDDNGSVYLLAEIGTPGSVVVKVSEESATPCVGDCDGDRGVAVSELVRAVNIALGALAVEECLGADSDGDGTVTIAELIQAVNAALGGCP
jgi:hypothetical protein